MYKNITDLAKEDVLQKASEHLHAAGWQRSEIVVSWIFPHQINDFIVHPPGGVQAPDEVEVIPLRNALVVHQLGDLSQ